MDKIDILLVEGSDYVPYLSQVWTRYCVNFDSHLYPPANPPHKFGWICNMLRSSAILRTTIDSIYVATGTGMQLMWMMNLWRHCIMCQLQRHLASFILYHWPAAITSSFSPSDCDWWNTTKCSVLITKYWIMVNTGKPSKGCYLCRARRIKVCIYSLQYTFTRWNGRQLILFSATRVNLHAWDVKSQSENVLVWLSALRKLLH